MDNPTYERNRVLVSMISNRFFFCPKVRVMEHGVRKVVGKKYDVTEDLQPYLRETMRLREFDGRPIGPVERELRSPVPGVITGQAYKVYQGARAALRGRGMDNAAHEDIMSEAIEAAEVLGL